VCDCLLGGEDGRMPTPCVASNFGDTEPSTTRLGRAATRRGYSDSDPALPIRLTPLRHIEP
jgi:hypothetical protein